uniref:Uncharacterized protein n=1 Tax=Ophidocladus simpliciusculus TaxID=1261574 RepID=A0A1Z1MIM9_9FLOR|nr:hypothetical protein [Ophidocladus simpliciusculus]ARW65930.1 hypothetical protein [Ophidocladus simpliciusculus]
MLHKKSKDVSCALPFLSSITSFFFYICMYLCYHKYIGYRLTLIVIIMYILKLT